MTTTTDAGAPPAFKRARPEATGPLTIATHSGSFHADEALACAMLRTLPTFADARIVRTRDPAVLADADIVVDVGGEYDAARHRYDHHQRSFAEVFAKADAGAKAVTKLSSAGLVYRHFGREVVAQLLGWPANHPALELVYQRIYTHVIEAYDANDNGVARYPAGTPAAFKDSSSIYAQVSRLNPAWNEEGVDVAERFAEAMALTGGDFARRVRYTGHAWLPGRELVEAALTARHASGHSSGRILVLEHYCPWKEHLYDLEAQLDIPEAERPLFCLYADGTSGAWRVQAVADAPESFASRKALPDPWRGVRDAELSTLSGIPGCVFVHASGFIGGNASREGALAMAVRALEWSEAPVSA